MSSDLNAIATPGYGFSTNTGTTPSGGNASFLYPHHDLDVARALITTANALVTPPGVGIYATDETPEGIEARLVAASGAENSKTYTDDEKRERRRRWRECLYESLPTGVCLENVDRTILMSVPLDYISGVILYYETLIDFKLADVLTKRGIIPGVRADTDSHPLPISPSEPATQGLDDLLPRLQLARANGARFTKVFTYPNHTL